MWNSRGNYLINYAMEKSPKVLLIGGVDAVFKRLHHVVVGGGKLGVCCGYSKHILSFMGLHSRAHSRAHSAGGYEYASLFQEVLPKGRLYVF